jgi:hypothetical protein
VEVRESGGKVHTRRLDDVVNASAAEVRARFRTATESVVGAGRASQIAIGIETLDRSDDAGQLAALLRT